MLVECDVRYVPKADIRPPYSITSSALLVSCAGDKVRPRVFAVRIYSRVVFAMSLSRK